MVISFVNNIFKRTVFGNILSFSNYFVLYWYCKVLHYYVAGGIVPGTDIVFLSYLLFALVQILMFLFFFFFLGIELLCKHRLKSDFFEKNRIYNIFFNVGFWGYLAAPALILYFVVVWTVNAVF